jgi:hypothetical protein
MQENTQKKFGAFSSSEDPTQISLTIQSALKILGTVVGAFAALRGLNLVVDNSTIQQIADAITLIITSGIAIYHSGDFLWGVGRKALHQIYG